MKTFLFAAASLAVLAAAPAQATSYTFNVNYSGGGNAALAGGSDNPLATALASGDTFTYRLSATGTGQWTTLSAGSVFPFFALSGDYGSFNIDYTLNLNNNGASVFTNAQNGATGCCAHLGTNTVSFGGGLVYDQYELVATINSLNGGSGVGSGLLPWPGVGPEQWSPQFIAFAPGAGAVPEPGAWALLILGFGALGGAMRRQRQGKLAFA